MKINTAPVVSLVIANISPLIGVLFFDWDMFQTLLLYWTESGVIGLFSILRLIKTNWVFGLVYSPFFVLHFGGFMAGHLMILCFLFTPDQVYVFKSFTTFISLLNSVTIGFIAFFISHGISFILDLAQNKKYKYLDGGNLLFAPYKRVILMHFTILMSALFVTILPESGVLLLVLLKFILDYWINIKEFRKIYNLPRLKNN